MHTLFTLEDLYGLHVDEIDGEICLRLDRHTKEYTQMFKLLYSWNSQYQKMHSCSVTKDSYNEWRYNYTLSDSDARTATAPADEISDVLLANPSEN